MHHRQQHKNQNNYYPQIAVAYTSLEALQEHGIATNDIQKLNAAGYFTLESVAHATARKLQDVKGISEAKVQKLKEIVKTMVPMDFKTAADALEDRKAMVTLTTGSTELDKMLEGGIETGLSDQFGKSRRKLTIRIDEQPRPEAQVPFKSLLSAAYLFQNPALPILIALLVK